MSRGRTIAVLSILALLVGVVIGALPAQAANNGGPGIKQLEPAENSAINYPGYPVRYADPNFTDLPAVTGGPYIVAATYRPAAVSGDALPDVILVFNEDLSAASVSTEGHDGPGGDPDNPDFIPVGFTYDSAELVAGNANLVRLIGVTAGAAGDQVRLGAIEAVAGDDGSLSTHLSPVTLVTGPVITDVEVTAGYGDSLVGNDSVQLTFDADITGTGFSEDTAFWTTPEFNFNASGDNQVSAAIAGNTVTLTWPGGPARPWRQIRAGVTKIWMEANSIRWDAVATFNSARQVQAVEVLGPYIVAAYYSVMGTPASTTDDQIWIVMSQPIDPVASDFAGNFLANYFTGAGAGFAFTNGNVASAFPLDFSPVLTGTSLGGEPPPLPDQGVSTVEVDPGAGGDPLVNYQGLAEVASTVPVWRGIGILRASYDDRRTAVRTDDQLYIWLNEPVATPANIGLDDFTFTTFNTTGLNLESGLDGSQYRITISGFTTANYPRPGARVQAVAGSGIFGTISGGAAEDELDGGEGAPWIRVEDESRPYTLQIVENDPLTYDRWDAVNEIDSVFVSWTEAGIDDSDQYFLFVTMENPGNIDQTWMNSKLPKAIALGNLRPNVLDNGLMVHRVGLLLDPDEGVVHPGAITQSMDDTDPDLQVGEQVYILVAAADYSGNLSLRFDQNSQANHLFGAFLVGPLCAPRDHISASSMPAEADPAEWDYDVIHVVGDSTATGIAYFVYGDPGAIPCSADSVVAFRTGAGVDQENWLGAVPVNADGSFSFLDIDETRLLDDDRYIFLRTRTGEDYSAATPIIFDRSYPYVQADPATAWPDYVFDPWNPYRIYGDGDYVNVRMLLTDAFADSVGGVGSNANARSALLHAWADFTRLDLTADPTEFSTPPDSILFTSLGNDLVDNDGDWVGWTDVNDNGTYDEGVDPVNDDTGIDGLGPGDPGWPGRDTGEADGQPTAGDPWVDENGDGSYTLGETFLDRVQSNLTPAAIRDPGEANVDSSDPDEFGWYEIRNNTVAARGTVKQGYVLANPNPDARLWPYTPVQIWIEDNGIDRANAALPLTPGYPEDRELPYNDLVNLDQAYLRTLNHVTTHLGTDDDPWDPERSFLTTIDLQPPTVAEITGLWKELGAGTNSPTNIIVPGNPTYNLGRWVDFTTSTLSDADVLYNRAQLKVGANWRDLNLDPSTASGAADDGNGDGFPGAEGYDEDADSLSAQANGIDDDEDGLIDESGEGIDFADPEVAVAAQDSVQDAAATNSNGLHAQNDFRDNDNDAFFVYESYENGGLVGVGDIGRIVWYNIDESTTNNFDDDNDGVIDEADEVDEATGYGDGAEDDNEDGIVNGEAVALNISTFNVLAGDLATTGNFQDAHGGVPATTIWVDAAHVYGLRPLAGLTNSTDDFYFNGVAYTEPVTGAFEILTNSVRTFPADGYDLDGGSDSTSTQVFNWRDMHPSTLNLDLELITMIHGLTADGITEYGLRTLAYDKAGNMETAWTEPIEFTIDLEGPPAQIPGCVDDPDPDPVNGFPEDFADISPALDGRQIWDSGKHPETYTLTVTEETNESDADLVYFITSTDRDSIAIYAANPGLAPGTRVVTDPTAPYTAEWPFNAAGMFAMDNYPYNHQQTWYFAVVGVDEFGNPTPEADLCIFEATVIDGTDPIVCLAQVGEDADLRDGAVAPQDSSINVYVYQQAAPLPGRWDDNDGLGWVGGLDRQPGVAGFDDDGDGSADEDDVDGDGIYTEGVDDPGADLIPGTDDDEWNGAGANLGETDDYITNDIVMVVFQMNPVADDPDQGWITFASVHGDTNSVPGQVIDWTEPVKATWNTWDLETGDYNLRAYGVDWEGNSNELTACIATVGIRSNPLRAYIQPEVCSSGLAFDLYAVHYIHDYEIDKVRFEYYYDADGNLCADDGGDWTLIDIDDVTSADPRGDAVLYPGSTEQMMSDPIEDLAFQTFAGTDYRFFDPDEDGYSLRDPVIRDVDLDGTFSAGDIIVIGENTAGDELETGSPLTAFPADHFWADAEAGANGLEPTDWIFRENRLTGNNGTLDNWMVAWDATGLPEGNYLVRAIAIDENNQQDVIDYTCYAPNEQNPEEIELVRLDTLLPDTEITELTLPDGEVIDVSSIVVPPYVSGNTKWLRIAAEGDDDTARMLFEYSLNGGVDWVTLDVNNDDDFYANLDGTPGFQSGDVDELFNDLNGNFAFDPDVDFVRSAGDNGVVDTPAGWPLLPLSGEEATPGYLTDGIDNDGDTITDEADEGWFADGIDQDGDGQVDEDMPAQAAVDGENPHDYSVPFYVYLDISDLDLLSDVNVLFRATAFDLVCNDIYRADQTPDILAVIIGENQAPMADIIRTEDLDGVEIDVRPDIMDGSGVATIGSDVDTMRVFVTAEDVSSVVGVDLFYRLDPNCYELTVEEMQWQSMSAQGWTLPDSVYPYDFNVDTDAIPDGAYQFYPRAYDANETFNEGPIHPWGFKKFGFAGEDFAFVSDPAPPPAAPDTAAVGDEYIIEAELIQPDQAPVVAVEFYYAPRVLDEMIDPATVQPLVPFVSEDLAFTILGAESGDGVVLTIDGELATYHSDLSEVPAPTKLDFTIINGDQIVFGARPDMDDVILVDYNFGSWAQIGAGDPWSPYTVAWDQEDGGVPEPPTGADAYDLVAIALFDLNGNGGAYEPGCDAREVIASEGNHLVLDDQERPLVILYGLTFDDMVEPFDCGPDDWNWPGNPLFRSHDELEGPLYENKLSGIEADVFVVAQDVGGGSIESVVLDITASGPDGAPGNPVHIDMVEYTAAAEEITLPITFYEADYPEWSPEMIENVVLRVGDRDYQMIRDAATGSWGAEADFPLAAATEYQFVVDLVGDQQLAVCDARNFCPLPQDACASTIRVPATPFWYAHIDSDTQLTESGVHRVVVTATDSNGNTGTNLNAEMPEADMNQGPIVFIYDTTAPVVNSVSVTDPENQPLRTDRVTPARSYLLWANVTDAPFEDFDVMTVDRVRFEYSPYATPGATDPWIHIGTDEDPSDGVWHVSWTPTSGRNDGYDNDRDGLWDEEDEWISGVVVRAIAVDDGMNSGYSDRQTPAVILALTVDQAEPTAVVDEPADGEVFAYDEAIAITGTARGDDIPPGGEDDLAEARFQAKISRYYYVDETYNGVGHAGYYDNGIDEVWFDTDGDGTWNTGDIAKFAGQNGTPQTVDASDVNYWFDLDPTPVDNSDLPALDDPTELDDLSMVWMPAQFSFITADELGGDEYVRLRLFTTDTAGNEDTAADLNPPRETLIILNDDTVPRAYVTHVGTHDQNGVVDPVEVKPIQALDPVMVYGRYFGAVEITQVNLYMIPDGGTATFIGADTDLVDREFEIRWDAVPLAEGEYVLYATAVDVDMNESDPALATRVTVRIDRTPPIVLYTEAVNDFAPFVASAPYTDDGIVDNSSLAIVPDALTHDVNFIVTTPDADVETMALQWRWATDPVGLWRPVTELFEDGTVLEDGAFDYEPNLNFEVGGVAHHVWWLHVENFAEQLLVGGRMEFRALATDEAGNTNALQTELAAYTADNTNPTGFDWNDDSVTNQVEVGSTVNFEISLQDGLLDDNTRTDVVNVALQYRAVGTEQWIDYGFVVPEGVQIDTGEAMWIARFAWIAPDFVVHDTAYEFRVLATDTAGNTDEWSRSGYTITVEDNAAPDRSKIVDIVARICSAPDAVPPFQGDDGPNDDVWVDLNDTGEFEEGSDWLISAGADLNQPIDGTACVDWAGFECGTFPRRVGEGYLNDPAGPGMDRQIVKVSDVVTLVGRTQSDDDGIGQLDTGIQTVTFVLQPVDENGQPSGEPVITVGVDEYRPGFPLFYWHYIWDTTTIDDGFYRAGVWAMDEEGNVEDQTSLDWTNAIIQVDNTGPEAQMDADATTEAVERAVTIERNEPFTLFARTLVPGTATPENYEDDAVTFYYKRSRDLNMADSWKRVMLDTAADPNMPEDGNPDLTRPYSFDVNMGLLPDPTYPLGEDLPVVPIAVGEYYDFAVYTQDEVCNATTQIESFADSLVAGVGARYIRVLIQDTIAPHLEITRLDLNGECHDENDNPTAVHARGFEFIEAKLLTGALDLSHVEFVYRLEGTQDWSLIDAVLTPSEDRRTWTLGSWDLQTLQHGAWYEVAAVGVDDIGNVDQLPDILRVYVDYEAPVVVNNDFVLPENNLWCNGVLDLALDIDRGGQQQHDDVCDIVWLWKKSTDPDVLADSLGQPGWNTEGIATVEDLYDDTLTRYSNTLNLDATDGELALFPTNLYDLRAVVMDDAGNVTFMDAMKNVVDRTVPDYVQISNILLNGDDTTQDPGDFDQFTDVTAGTMVEIFGTASDDEEDLPNFPDPQTGDFYETMIAIMQFQVAYDLNEDGNADDGAWHDLGVIHLDPPTLGDMSAQTASVLWNTTGLPEGQYLLRVIAFDACGNGAPSAAVNVRVLDWTPPIARIVAWDGDQQPHGTEPPSLVTIYALAECDATDADLETPGWQPTYDVQLQYQPRTEGQPAPNPSGWVNIGIAEPSDDGYEFTTEQLWQATVNPELFGDGVTSVWLRALVKDEMGNRFGDSPDDVIPTVAVNVVSEVIDTDDPTITDGTITLEAVRSADLTNGTIEVEDVSWMVESPTHLIVTVNMADEDQTPRVVLLSEPAEPSVYPSDDNPTNYSPGVYVDGVLVGLTRSLDDATVWRGEIFLEDPATCTHYALWVSGLDGISGPAQWIDLGTVHMREFVVTTALGTNGTVDVPAYNGLELEVMVPSAAWPNDPTCLLVSPTVPPFLSVDQERYLEPVDSTAYHLELLTGTGEFVRGREPLVNIYYDEANALARALMNVADEDVDESDLTVRRWDFGSSNVDGTTGAWTGAGISHIKVYPDENRVSFRVRDLTGGGSSGSEERVTIDMALALDGSGSIDAADFTLQLQGVAAALQDQTIIPRDGSFSIAVVQFGAASGDAVVEIPLTTVTSDAVAQTLATQVLAIVQGDGGTPMAEGIEVSVDALATGTGTVQVIVLATDGAPNDGAAALAAADAAVAAGIDEIHAIGVGAGADLVFLGQLVRNGTVDVAVDYEEFAQVIGSKLRSIISGAQGGQGRVFQLFLPKRNAPVVVSSIWPDSPYVTDWRTDADPVIVAYLRDPGGQAINPAEVQLLIDNEEWATWMDGEGDAEFIRGNGEATLTYVNQEQTVMELVYHHSTYPRDWLRDSTDPQAADSVHTLTIRYRASGGTDDWQEWMEPFRVDRKSPYIEFDGGFVGNPRLNNVAGYMNPAGDRLIARMYDGGMGILFKHDRPWYFQDLDCDGLLNLDERQFDPWPYPELEDYFGCWVRSDWGVKYDVWRIDPSCPEPCHEDDQSDIDEIEERHLLYTGTAGAIEPYLMVDGERITLDEYDPADTLEVPVVNLGGGSIKDGDVLEITWYSEKWIEANSDGPGFGCPIDTMWVGGDQILVWSAGCSWDSQSQEMHLYQEGIQDWASNSGSQYAEQRFIVDSSGPNCAIVSPQATVEPNGDLVIDVTFDDTGVGIDGESIEVTVIDPEGNVHTPDDINPVDGRFQAVIEGPLMRGEWQVRVTAEDALDNACNSVRTVRVEAAVLTMAGAYVSPNPFNPNDLSNGMATIFLNLSRASFVTAKVYDFAGLEVATLANNEWMTPGQNLQWSGQARGQGNTDLANGAYIIRVTADDGVRTVESNLKVVIWRE